MKIIQYTNCTNVVIVSENKSAQDRRKVQVLVQLQVNSVHYENCTVHKLITDRWTFKHDEIFTWNQFPEEKNGFPKVKQKELTRFK